MKIGRRIGIVRVARDEPRGDIQRPAKSDRQMSEVTADAGPSCQRVASARMRGRRSDEVVDVVAYPLADTLYALVPAREGTEFAHRQREKHIGFAVSRGQQVRKDFCRQPCNGELCCIYVGRAPVDLDISQVAHGQSTRRSVDAKPPVHRCRVVKLLREQRWSSGQRFHDDALIGRVRNQNVQNKNALLPDVVVQFAIDVKDVHWLWAMWRPALCLARDFWMLLELAISALSAGFGYECRNAPTAKEKAATGCLFDRSRCTSRYVGMSCIGISTRAAPSRATRSAPKRRCRQVRLARSPNRRCRATSATRRSIPGSRRSAIWFQGSLWFSFFLRARRLTGDTLLS